MLHVATELAYPVTLLGLEAVTGDAKSQISVQNATSQLREEKASLLQNMAGLRELAAVSVYTRRFIDVGAPVSHMP